MLQYFTINANVFVYGFFELSTKLTNKQKPIVQQRGNSERNFGSNELYTLLATVFKNKRLLT